MLMQRLVYANYATILIVLFLVVFLFSNVSFSKRTVKLFMIAIISVLVLVIVDSIESYTETLSYPTKLRVWMSAIGYTVRPVSVLCVLFIITKNTLKRRIVLMIPGIINALVSFSALFCGLAFSYSETNEFVRGPLGFTAYVTSAVYLIILCVATVDYIQRKDYRQALIVIGIVVIIVVSTLLEAVFKFEGFINVSIAISVTFYYLFYHTQNYKNDSLTGVLNRLSYDVDIIRNSADITAIVSLDLNYLKVLNDTKGHAEGDKALMTVALCIRRNLIRGCQVYRVGGDEFEILYTKSDVTKLDKMIDNIRNDIERNSYSCAIGLAIREGNEEIDALTGRADTNMYTDKLQRKEKK